MQPKTNAGIRRRDVLRALGLGGAALAAPGLMLRAAHGAAPMLGASVPDVYRFKLGEFEVTTLRDGWRAGDGPHPVFGANMPAAEVHALLRQNGLPETRFITGFTPTLVNTGKELVLFDTGNGAGGRANGVGNLAAAVVKAGYTPDQVDTVVISHMHPDHIGGLMENGAPAFANAGYVSGEAEHAFWSAPERLTGPSERVAKIFQGNVAPLAARTRFVKEGGQIAGGITAVEAFGHTPGHLAFHVESAGRRLMITADAANHYVVSLQQPDWEVSFDAMKPVAAATRRKLFGMIAADRIPFIGYHMPWPSIGFVEPLGQGFRYIANTYQVDL
jgi:glyoxylase-like metal-dependent hydrolase (beta-lactamase superfamily II)